MVLFTTGRGTPFGTYVPTMKVSTNSNLFKNKPQWIDFNAGVIAEGKLADALLVSLASPRMVPRYSLTSNWVYAADSECIDTVICDGRIVMQHRHVDGEEDIINAIRKRYSK